MQSIDHLGMGFSEDDLHLVNVASTDARQISDLSPHVDVLSFRQICQSLFLAAGRLIGKSFRLEIWFLLKRQLCTCEGVPPGLWSVEAQKQLQRFVVIKREFGAVDS